MIIPNFLGGIGQQPDDTRPPNQVKDAVNASFSPIQGCYKRYPTNHLGTIAEADLSGYAAFPLDRDGVSYVILVGDEDIKVVDTEGTEVLVKDSSNSPSYDPDFSYLAGVTKDTVRAQAVVDTVFVTNTETTVAGDEGATEASWVEPGEAGFFVKQGAHDTRYTITIKTTSMVAAETVTVFSAKSSIFNGDGASPTDLNTVTASGGQTSFTVSGAFNTSQDLQFQSVAGSGTWNSSPSAWEPGPAEFEMLYIGSPAITAGDQIKFRRINPLVHGRGIQTNFLAYRLKEKLNDLAITGLAFEGADNEDSAFRVYSTTEAIEIFEVTDSKGNTLMTAWRDSVENITDLPTVWKDGAVIKITGGKDTEEAGDDYYVKFVADSGTDVFGPGRWEETALPDGATGAFDADTMPHVLVRSVDDGLGTVTGTPNEVYFDWQPYANWNTREAGDNISNPEPSFVGSTIKDIFYWQDRLGFLSDASIVLSEAGNISNFWRITILSLPESEVIDIQSTDDLGSSLLYAAPMDTRLFAFSKQSQIVVVGDPVLTPQSIQAPVVSKFLAAEDIPAVLLGRSLYFAYVGRSYLGFKEFIPGDSALQFGDIDITAHVPKLIPKGSGRIVGCTSDNSLYFHSSSDPSSLYVYQYFRAGVELLQSSWSRWEFTGEIIDVLVIDEVLYLVTLHGGHTYLESIPLGEGQVDAGSGIVARLDRKIQTADVTVSSYDVANDTTAFVLPYKFVAEDDINVVTQDDIGLLQIDSITPATKTVVVRGDHTATDLWFGVAYGFTVALNRPTVQIPQGQGRVPVRSDRTTVKRLSIILDDTGFTEATVRYRGGATYTYPFTGHGLNVLGVGLESNDFEGDDPIRDAVYTVPIHAGLQDFEVTISNLSPLPCSLVSGEWHVQYGRNRG